MMSLPFKRRGFTLMETVIAIGVLAVLITAFMAVFGPATAGIRRAINVQEADRLASTLEREIATLRQGEATGTIQTGFDKAFKWISEGNAGNSTTAGTVPGIIFVYQYRGNPGSLRPDGTLKPYTRTDGVAGTDYVIQATVRRRDDSKVAEDLQALEGRVFAVKTTQLVFDNGALKAGSPGKIIDPKGSSAASSPQDYPEAVIAYTAEFYSIQSTAPNYLTGAGFGNAKLLNPVFTRNLAARR